MAAAWLSGPPSRGEETLRAALAIKQKLLGAENPDVADAQQSRMLLTDLGRPAEAVTVLEPAVAILRGRLAPAMRGLCRSRDLRNRLVSTHLGRSGLTRPQEEGMRSSKHTQYRLLWKEGRAPQLTAQKSRQIEVVWTRASH
jgi:hypothetical protein